MALFPKTRRATGQELYGSVSRAFWELHVRVLRLELSGFWKDLAAWLPLFALLLPFTEC